VDDGVRDAGAGQVPIEWCRRNRRRGGRVGETRYNAVEEEGELILMLSCKTAS